MSKSTVEVLSAFSVPACTGALPVTPDCPIAVASSAHGKFVLLPRVSSTSDRYPEAASVPE